MLKEVEALGETLRSGSSFRVTFALAPFHGSDRQVGWSALEADQAASREITYVTTQRDFDTIASHCPDAILGRAIMQLGTVKVVAWPFELSQRLLPIGYLRYLIWVILLQIFASYILWGEEAKKFTFLLTLSCPRQLYSGAP